MFAPTRFAMHDDVITLLMSFLFEISAQDLRCDLNYYIEWRYTVPDVFLACSLFEERLLHHVGNPMRKHFPYYPRKFLSMRPCDIWSPSLMALGTMLSPAGLRNIKTYRRCAFRWIIDCIDNREIHYYIVLKRKLLDRLTISQFRIRSHLQFVQEALRQVASCTPAVYDEGF